MLQPLWEKVLSISFKTNYILEILLLGIYPIEMKTYFHKKILYKIFKATVFKGAQKTRNIPVSIIEEWKTRWIKLWIEGQIDK